VQVLIEQANSAARRQEWAEAKNLFLEAMRHEYFSWEAAAYDDDRLGVKLAALFVLTRDGRIARRSAVGFYLTRW